MDGSERLRNADVRGVFKVVDECRELWADPASWRMHLIAGAARLTAAATGLLAEYPCSYSSTHMRPRVVASAGWPDEAAPSRCMRLLNDAVERAAPRLLRRGDAAMTLAPTQSFRLASVAGRVVGDDRPSDSYRFAVALRTARREPLTIQMIAVGRRLGDRLFDARRLKILRLLQGEIAALAGTRLATEDQRSIMGLPSRCLPTLEGLLSGQSEKEIAAASHRSRNTIHEHVTTIYRHFEVSSRGELLAYFILRTPLPRMASPKRVNLPRVPALTC